MEKTVTLKDGLQKSQQQYHSITKMTGNTKVRMFACAMGQHLRKYHGYDVEYSYRWVKTKDGLYFALSGSRSVQDVFAAYLDNNNGDYFDSATVTHYGRHTVQFNRAFDKLVELKHGRFVYGETK